MQKVLDFRSASNKKTRVFYYVNQTFFRGGLLIWEGLLIWGGGSSIMEGGLVYPRVSENSFQGIYFVAKLIRITHFCSTVHTHGFFES